MKDKIEEIRGAISKKLNIKEQLPNLMRVLIERIEVEKINNDRKHVKLIIYFNFKADIISKELEIDNRKRGTYELSNFYPKKCSSVASKVTAILYNLEICLGTMSSGFPAFYSSTIYINRPTIVKVFIF